MRKVGSALMLPLKPPLISYFHSGIHSTRMYTSFASLISPPLILHSHLYSCRHSPSTPAATVTSTSATTLTSAPAVTLTSTLVTALTSTYITLSPPLILHSHLCSCCHSSSMPAATLTSTHRLLSPLLIGHSCSHSHLHLCYHSSLCSCYHSHLHS